MNNDAGKFPEFRVTTGLTVMLKTYLTMDSTNTGLFEVLFGSGIPSVVVHKKIVTYLANYNEAFRSKLGSFSTQVMYK